MKRKSSILIIGILIVFAAIIVLRLHPANDPLNENVEALLQTESSDMCYIQTAGGGFNGYVIFCYTKLGQPVKCMGPNYGHFSYSTKECAW